MHIIATWQKIHPLQVSQWKKGVTVRLPELFARKSDGEFEEMKMREKALQLLVPSSLCVAVGKAPVPRGGQAPVGRGELCGASRHGLFGFPRLQQTPWYGTRWTGRS